jgi:hypothetical protein
MIASIVIGLLVLLIAYWWANAGAWSAFLHMLCVVFAGVLAFALWEPLAYVLIPRGMADYALGLSLLGLFLGFLVVLRLALDRLVPANLLLPRVPNFMVGATFGLVSGVLTMGMFVLGCGFLQSTARIGDVDGWLRRSDVPKAPTIGSDNAPLLNLVGVTVEFYGFLSSNAYAPWLGGGSLRTHTPELTKTALSLYRDSYSGGTARVGIPPAAVSQLAVLELPPMPLDPGVGAAPVQAYAVKFNVGQDAFDGNGQQFVLSASQARLVGTGERGRATVARPSAWFQKSGDKAGMYFFNSPTNYATTTPGAGEGEFVLLFPKKDLEGQAPRFFELKGVRFPIAKVQAAAEALADLMGSQGAEVKEDAGIEALASGIDMPDPTWSLPTTLNSNDKGGLTLDGDNYILDGEQRFDRRPTGSVGSDLRIRGFKPAEGTRIVRLDCSAVPGGTRLWPELNPWVRESGATAQDARIALVDANGVKYYTVGYAEDDGMWLNVKSGGGNPLRLRDVPIQTLGSNKKLLLYFRVPTGVVLKYLALDTKDGLRGVNSLNFPVTSKEQP